MVRLASFPVSLFQYINITMQHSHFVFAVAISINNCHAVCYNSQVVRISYLYWKGIITGKVPSTIASLLCDHATCLYEFLMITPFSLSATLVILLCGTINPLLQYSSSFVRVNLCVICTTDMQLRLDKSMVVVQMFLQWYIKRSIIPYSGSLCAQSNIMLQFLVSDCII